MISLREARPPDERVVHSRIVLKKKFKQSNSLAKDLLTTPQKIALRLGKLNDDSGIGDLIESLKLGSDMEISEDLACKCRHLQYIHEYITNVTGALGEILEALKKMLERYIYAVLDANRNEKDIQKLNCALLAEICNLIIRRATSKITASQFHRKAKELNLV
jgi:hypothetical protein